eukprot:COSAG01_NODE_2372_length_7810_cov_5.360135_7_plen_274_part_01
MKRLAFSCGDPAGIGLEVTLKALQALPQPWGFQAVLFGTSLLFEQPLYREILSDLEDDLDLRHVYDLSTLELGRATADQGSASAKYIEAATQAVLSGACQALVTAPINKQALHLAGLPYTGHTTYLKALTGADFVTMAFYSEVLKVVLATVHEPLSAVPDLLAEPGFLEKRLRHAEDFARGFATKRPKIALAGLNPHAGEGGLFGCEEENILAPVLAACHLDYAQVSGPYAPDTVFRRAVQGEFDCVLALYHDQGLIPLKLLAFDDAVNVTLGL